MKSLRNYISEKGMFTKCSIKRKINQDNKINIKNLIYNMRRNNKALYEQIMRSVSKEVKRALNEQSEYGYNYVPRNRDELEQAIQEHYDNDIYDLNDIDVSHITDFSRLFYEDKNTGKRGFNICDWDVSNGEDFSEMFYRCYSFNCDLSNWDVTSGKDFRWMFAECKNFKANLSNWDMRTDAYCDQMFYHCPILDYYKPLEIIKKLHI